MPNPASSGTGFLDVSSWLQMMGEEKGWAFMDALHQNIAAYTHSGSKPCTLAAAGEYPIGVSFEFRAARLINEGAPARRRHPLGRHRLGYGGLRHHQGHRRAGSCQALLDWAVSDEAMAIYADNYAILAKAAMEKPVASLPAGIREKLIKNDFAWAANNRARILEEWQKRYDGKSEART